MAHRYWPNIFVNNTWPALGCRNLSPRAVVTVRLCVFHFFVSRYRQVRRAFILATDWICFLWVGALAGLPRQDGCHCAACSVWGSTTSWPASRVKSSACRSAMNWSRTTVHSKICKHCNLQSVTYRLRTPTSKTTCFLFFISRS